MSYCFTISLRVAGLLEMQSNVKIHSVAQFLFVQGFAVVEIVCQLMEVCREDRFINLTGVTRETFI